MRISSVINIGKGIAPFIVCFGLLACDSASNFGIPQETQIVSVAGTEEATKVDVLWVVDSSGSMESSQDAVASNFASFIDGFQEKKFDFQMAVVSTDAWVDFQGTTHDDHAKSFGLSRFNDAIRDKDGKNIIGNTGVFVMTPDTPNLNQVFIDNIKVGVTGNADERTLQSMVAALENPANQADGFPRNDALLAVIFVTDEDDFSHNGETHLNLPSRPDNDPYNEPALHPVEQYYDYLMTYTDSKPEDPKFIVNSIGIRDNDCLRELEVGWNGRRIDVRNAKLAEMTGGYQGSLCDKFSDVMKGIKDRILEYSTRYPLGREPRIETIKVLVDGQVIPQNNINGWTYDIDSNSIVFHGTAVPVQGQKLAISFDPATLKKKN